MSTADLDNVFRVYNDFKKEFEITGIPGMTPYAASDRSEISKRTFSPRNCRSSTSKKNVRVHLTYFRLLMRIRKDNGGSA